MDLKEYLEILRKTEVGYVRVFDSDFNEIDSFEIKKLKKFESEAYLIFLNGEINQKIIDLCKSKKISVIVGKKIGNLDYVPKEVEIYSEKYIKNYLKKKVFRITVLGYKNPLLTKTLEILEEVKGEKDFEYDFVDLAEHQEYFEKYDIRAVPLLMAENEVVKQGVPTREEIFKILGDERETVKKISLLIRDCEENLAKLKSLGGNPQKFVNDISKAKDFFNKDEFEKAFNLIQETNSKIKREIEEIGKPEERWCSRCGAFLDPKDEICPRCGFSGVDTSSEETEILIERCEELKEKLSVLKKRYVLGEIADETYQILRQRIEGEIEKVSAELRNLGVSEGCT